MEIISRQLLMSNSKPGTTLIASDWHLGGLDHQPTRILQTLQSITADRFIMLGDMYNDPISKTSRPDIVALEQFITAMPIEKIFIQGNHDYRHLNPHIPGLGFRMFPENIFFSWEIGGHRHMAIHGHQFDGWIHKLPWYTHFGDRIVHRIKKWFPSLGFWLDQKARDRSGKISRMVRGAVAFAKANGADRIYIGHHHAHSSIKQHDGIEVVNVGCMTSKPHEQFAYLIEHPDRRIEIVAEANEPVTKPGIDYDTVPIESEDMEES